MRIGHQPSSPRFVRGNAPVPSRRDHARSAVQTDRIHRFSPRSHNVFQHVEQTGEHFSVSPGSSRAACTGALNVRPGQHLTAGMHWAVTPPSGCQADASVTVTSLINHQSQLGVDRVDDAHIASRPPEP